MLSFQRLHLLYLICLVLVLNILPKELTEVSAVEYFVADHYLMDPVWDDSGLEKMGKL